VNNLKCIGFEVLAAVVMKTSPFWHATPCGPLKLTDVLEKHISSIYRAEE
jgi:hypothetical protein